MTNQTIANSHTIGHRIRELRQKKGLTQAELGRLVGCAQPTVADWERKMRRAPSKLILAEVAKTLDVSLEYLFGIDKIDKLQIPCYGEVKSKEFIWISVPIYHIEIPKNEYSPNRFTLQVMDDFLEPGISKNDYAIFEKSVPKNGDVVAIRFLENDKGIVGMWRQEDNKVMVLETNLEKIGIPYFFEIISQDKDICFKIKKNTTKEIKIEGKLVAVRKGIKSISGFPKVSYILF